MIVDETKHKSPPFPVPTQSPFHHHCTLLRMHRHYKGLPPSSRCLAVGEYPRVDQVIAAFLRLMRIEYIALSTLYTVPLSAWSRWQGDVRTAHVVDAWYLLKL